MSVLLHHVAVVSQSPNVSFAQASLIAAALQKQVTRDFGPIWGIQATVSAFADLKHVPLGYWPIIIKDNIGTPGAAGVHLDRNGQPYALVQASAGTPLTCSHEMCEMLADPFGNRFVTSNSIKPGQGRVNYLVEVCDPSEADAFAYTVNGLLLSDFYTPHFFDPVTLPAVRYSFTGAIRRPKQVLRGGYLSWRDPLTGLWWQQTYFGGSAVFGGPYNWQRTGGRSWREVVDANTKTPAGKLRGTLLCKKKGPAAEAFVAAAAAKSSNAWAGALMKEVDALAGA